MADRKPPLSVRLDDELDERLRAHAEQRGEKLSPWVIGAITEKLEREERGDPSPEALQAAQALLDVPQEVWRYLVPLSKIILS